MPAAHSVPRGEFFRISIFDFPETWEWMPTCIYCRAQTTVSEGLPALNADKCNHYFRAQAEAEPNAIPAWPSPSSLGMQARGAEEATRHHRAH